MARRFDLTAWPTLAAGLLTAVGGTAAWIQFRPAPVPLLAAAFIGLGLVFFAWEIPRHGPTSPAVLFILGLAYYHVLIPVEYLVDPALPRSLLHEYPSLTEGHLVKPMWAAVLGLVAFLAGYTRHRTGAPSPIPWPIDERRLVLVALGLISIGAVLYFSMSVIATGSLGGIFNTTYQERDELFYGLGALGFGINLIYVGLICLGTAWISGGGSIRTGLAIGLCAMMGLHSFLVGSKMHVFHVGLGTLAGSRVAGGRMRPMAAAALLFILAVPLLFVGLARNKQGEGLGAMAEFVEEEADSDSLNPANIDAWGPFLTVVHTTASKRVPQDLQWGSTYLQVVTLLPPRFLYPNRPTPADEEFAKDFLGKDYYDNAGFGYSAITEAYSNFGFPGVALAFLLAGLGLGWFRDRFLRRDRAFAGALVVATAAPWVTLAVRDQAAGLVKGYGLMTLAPTLAILFLARHRPSTQVSA